MIICEIMNFNSKKTAFTLIETLIASVLLVVIVGTAVVANRSIQTSSSRSEEYAQMSALASEALDQVRFLKNSNPGSFYTLLGLNPVGDNKYIVFVGNNEISNNCTYGLCNPIESGGPAKLIWCQYSDNACRQMPSPVCLSASNCNMQDVFAEIDFKLGNSGHVSGDYLAIRRNPYSTTTNLDQHRMVVDLQNPLSSMSAALRSTVDTDQWNFYSRIINVQCIGTGGASTGFLQAANLDELKKGTYVVKVTLTNLNNPSSTVSQSTILTDWQ